MLSQYIKLFLYLMKMNLPYVVLANMKDGIKQ